MDTEKLGSSGELTSSTTQFRFAFGTHIAASAPDFAANLQGVDVLALEYADDTPHDRAELEAIATLYTDPHLSNELCAQVEARGRAKLAELGAEQDFSDFFFGVLRPFKGTGTPVHLVDVSAEDTRYPLLVERLSSNQAMIRDILNLEPYAKISASIEAHIQAAAASNTTRDAHTARQLHALGNLPEYAGKTIGVAMGGEHIQVAHHLQAAGAHTEINYNADCLPDYIARAVFEMRAGKTPSEPTKQRIYLAWASSILTNAQRQSQPPEKIIAVQQIYDLLIRTLTDEEIAATVQHWEGVKSTIPGPYASLDDPAMIEAHQGLLAAILAKQIGRISAALAAEICPELSKLVGLVQRPPQ